MVRGLEGGHCIEFTIGESTFMTATFKGSMSKDFAEVYGRELEELLVELYKGPEAEIGIKQGELIKLNTVNTDIKVGEPSEKITICSIKGSGITRIKKGYMYSNNDTGDIITVVKVEDYWVAIENNSNDKRHFVLKIDMEEDICKSKLVYIIDADIIVVETGHKFRYAEIYNTYTATILDDGMIKFCAHGDWFINTKYCIHSMIMRGS